MLFRSWKVVVKQYRQAQITQHIGTYMYICTTIPRITLGKGSKKNWGKSVVFCQTPLGPRPIMVSFFLETKLTVIFFLEMILLLNRWKNLHLVPSPKKLCFYNGFYIAYNCQKSTKTGQFQIYINSWRYVRITPDLSVKHVLDCF